MNRHMLSKTKAKQKQAGDGFVGNLNEYFFLFYPSLLNLVIHRPYFDFLFPYISPRMWGSFISPLSSPLSFLSPKPNHFLSS